MSKIKNVAAALVVLAAYCAVGTMDYNDEVIAMEHKTIQYGDEIQCHICGKAWDVKDQEPPPCRIPETPPGSKIKVTKKGAEKRRVRRGIEELKEQLALLRDC